MPGTTDYVISEQEKRDDRVHILCKEYAFSEMTETVFEEMLKKEGLDNEEIELAYDLVDEMVSEKQEVPF